MKTLDVELAMMVHMGFRKNLIVPNVSWGMNLGGRVLHECDLLVLSKAGYATEVEIKVSKSDLIKDKDKLHNHEHPYIKNLYFAVPERLKDVALDHIPERAGLYVVYKNKWGSVYVGMEKKARSRANAVKWSFEDRYNLARLGAIRIFGLKDKIRDLKKLLIKKD